MAKPRTDLTTAAVAKRSRRLAAPGVADACFFRSGPEPGQRKALIKITDRCDLRCSHCFVSATKQGDDMAAADLAAACSRLVEARVANVTVTGGEPLVHPDLDQMLSLLVEAGLDVTVCTNGVQVSDELIDHAMKLGRVAFNVSLDGARADSHGAFRGDRSTFSSTVGNLRRFAQAGLLKGMLCTPNALADPSEYVEVMELATDVGAEYVLMNPLSSFGRGIQNQRLAAGTGVMQQIRRQATAASERSDTEGVFIRFPNTSEPLTGCIAGDLFYIFVNGDVTVCPYLVFATENEGAQHDRDEFIVGNIFADPDIAERLDSYDFHARYPMGRNETCSSCGQNRGCGKGCPAAVIASGGRIGDLDDTACPVSQNPQPVVLRAHRR